MTAQQTLIYFSENGMAMTIHKLSGTACPCTTWANGDGHYSKQYHRDNTDDPDCDGTLIVPASKTDTTATIRALIADQGLTGPAMMNFTQEPIGIDKDYDKILFGGVDTSTNALYDFSALTEMVDYITYDSENYYIHRVNKVEMGRETIGYQVLLKRED